jgi:hypothetical protein
MYYSFLGLDEAIEAVMKFSKEKKHFEFRISILSVLFVERGPPPHPPPCPLLAPSCRPWSPLLAASQRCADNAHVLTSNCTLIEL